MLQLRMKECTCRINLDLNNILSLFRGERDVAQRYRAFAHGAMGRQIDPSWGGPNELFLVPASAPRLWDGAYKRTLAVNR